MPTARAAGLWLCACAMLAGCATDLGSEPPAGVSLAGTWRLDPAASDDPQKLLQHMREEAQQIINRARNYSPPPDMRGRQQTQGQSEADYANALFGPPGARVDPLQRSPMAHTIMRSVERGDFLTIRQGPGEFDLDYGGTRRSFTPGAHSVVSAEDGVGDQTTGWKGHAYLIVVKEQYGSTVTEEYSLSGDGSTLIDKLHVSAAELPAVSLTRIYRRSHESAPQLAPISD
jgi:hypothetical protein